MENQRLDELIEKYIHKTATIQEQQELLDWYHAQNDEAVAWFSERLNEEVLVKQRLLLNINKRIKPGFKSVSLWSRVALAAAAVAAVVFGLWFYNYEVASSRKAHRNNVAFKNDIAPGKNTATITLANGKTIQLSDAKTGVVIDAANLKYNDGSAVETGDARHLDDRRDPLNSTGKRSLPGGRDDGKGQYDGKVAMTSVATPRGGTYQITLPDGTKVWLNAASSLKFPATFAALKDRRVQLVGEAYFEVAKDKTHPFIVITDKQEVEVLGTHFNINSYADEPATKTTLLEGSVRVAYAPGHLESSPHPESSRHLDDRRTDQRELNETAKNNNSSELNLLNSTDKGSLPAGRDDGARRDDGQSAAITLKPNQQATNTGATIKVTHVDTELAIAWKNNQFMFESESIETIMKMVERWYDVEVIYTGQKPNTKFIGSLSRYENISKVLEMLESTGGVHFKIDGRKIYVSQ